MAGKLQEDWNRHYGILMHCSAETDINSAEFHSAVRVSLIVHFCTFNKLAIIYL